MKKHKKEILISLITGIILYYFQPILNFLGDKFITCILYISEGSSHFYFKLLAVNDQNAFSQSTNFLQIYVFGILIVYFILILQDKRRDLKRKLKTFLHTLQTNREKLKRLNEKKSKEEIEKEKESLLEDIDALENQINEDKSMLSKRDTKLIFLYVLSTFLIILLFSNYILTTSINKENVNFNNELIKIAPYVDDSLVKKLKSNWVQMKSQEDYNKIEADLNLINSKIKK